MHTNVLLLAVLFATTKSVLGDLKLLLLHNNDMHSHFEETSAKLGTCTKPGTCYGGFARIKKTVDDIRDKEQGNRSVLFLNAGDTFQGTPYFTIFHWQVVAELIDLLGIDVMSLGNHEFDDFPSGLAPYIEKIKTVSVTANIDITEEPSLNHPNLKPYEILNVNGTQIAVIGYLTPNTTYLSNTGKVKFLDEVETINKITEELKKQNIKIFIALGHSGYNIDLEIAKRCPDIDVVVGGHTNTFLYNGDPPDLEKPIDEYPKIVTQSSGKKVPVVQAFKYTKYLGYLELEFDDNGNIKSYSGNPILLSHEYPEDKSILDALEPWKVKLRNATDEVVGKTAVVLDEHNRACKFGECNIGNLIVDAMIETNSESYLGDGWTDAPLAITQAGGIRASINATDRDGNVTYGDITTSLPFEDRLLKAKIKGIHLRQVLEFAVHRYERFGIEQAGEFLQLAGIKVVYDMSAPSGSRVKSVKVRCAKCSVPEYSNLNDNEEYGIILNSFIAKGGDDFTILQDNIYDIKYLNTSSAKAVINYINKKTPIYPMITDRITVLNAPQITTKGPPVTVTTQNETTRAPTTHSLPEISSTEKPKGGANSLEYITSLMLFCVMYLATNIFNSPTRL